MAAEHGTGGAGGGLLSLPSSLVTLTILPLTDPTDLLAFRLANRGCYEYVHGNNGSNRNDGGEDEETRGESDELWRLALVRDFGFDSDKIDGDSDHGGGGEDEGGATVHHLKSFRHRPTRPHFNDVASGTSFVRTDELFVASTSFESWRHWTKLQNQFRSSCGRFEAVPRATVGGALALPPPHIVGPYFVRAAEMWNRIEGWCDAPGNAVGTNIRSALEPGCAVDLASYFKPLPGQPDADLPCALDALQTVFAFYGGQRNVQFPPTSDEAVNALFHGLFGGYSAYDNVVCTHLVSCRILVQQGGTRRGLSFIPIARNAFPQARRNITVGLRTGRVYVDLGKDDDGHDIVKSAVPERDENSSSDAVLLWLEEFASRLTRGVYVAGPVIEQDRVPPDVDTRAILLYPTERDTDATSRAVTRGIEVVASAVLAPEMNNVAIGMLIYSIRIRMLTPDEEGYVLPSERNFDTCQLRSRHWEITTMRPDDEEIVDHVRGDGVVGMYPLLREGGFEHYEGSHPAAAVPALNPRRPGTFVYQSCTEAMPGSFEGELEFVPGSLARPTGEPFKCKVAPFPLRQGGSFIF